MRSISISTPLDCSADDAFDALGSIQTFVHVARGAIRFPAAERVREPLAVGDEIVGWTFLLGVVPLTRHTLGIVRLDPAERVLVSNESGGFVRRWDHTISTTPTPDGCRYEDRIDIDAGILTPVVVAFAHAFYRYRQFRWRRLAPVLRGASQVRAAAVAVA